MAAFSTGIAVGFTSPIIPKLRGEVDPANNPLPYAITPEEESWVVGLFLLGATFAPFLTAFTGDRIGRKRTLQLFMIPGIASFIWVAFSTEVYHFCLARFLMGLGFGSSFSMLPMYVAEIAEDHNRGALGCFMTFFVCSGILFVYVVGPLLTVKIFSLICVFPPCLFLVLFTLFIPESPYYLLAKNDKIAAEASLEKLRNKSSSKIHKELMEIAENVEESFANKASVMDLFKSKGLFRGFLTIMGLMLFQQLSGINVVLSYMQSIFSASGTSIPADLSAIIVAVFQILTLLITVAIVDKLGRRILLLLSALGSCLSHAALGAFFFLQSLDYDVSSIFWLPIASLILFIVAFNLGFASIPWAVMGELFPANIKMVASTFACSLSMLFAFITSTFFPYLTAMIGISKSFWLFGGFCAVGFAFVYFVVPETKGKSLQEIQIMLSKGSMR